jgi:hypothetical protein
MFSSLVEFALRPSLQIYLMSHYRHAIPVSKVITSLNRSALPKWSNPIAQGCADSGMALSPVSDTPRAGT